MSLGLLLGCIWILCYLLILFIEGNHRLPMRERLFFATLASVIVIGGAGFVLGFVLKGRL